MPDSNLIRKKFNFDMDKFIKDSIDYRSMLANLWSQNSRLNRKTFCLGMTKTQNVLGCYYKQYYDLFLGLERSNYLKDWGKIKINYEGEDIYLLYHPSARKNLFWTRFNEIFFEEKNVYKNL